MDSVWHWVIVGSSSWAALSLAFGIVFGRAVRLADSVEADAWTDGPPSSGDLPRPVLALRAPA